MNDRPLKVWNWIKGVELKFGIKDKPVPDQYCEVLISKLESIMPMFLRDGLPKYSVVLRDDFVTKFELKLYKTPDKRPMLFDFIKDMIHLNLLRKDLYYKYGGI